MRILYAVQGTGNGHVCRAAEIVPLLSLKAEVDVLISGIQSDIQLPFPVKYVYNGLSFIFGKKGGVDLMATYRKSRIRKLLNEVQTLPVEDYDLVISDFEPVSSWACVFKNKPCVALSHQSAVINKKSPRPTHTDPLGKSILRYYAPATTSFGFHFKAYDDNIFTPVIRREVRETPVSDQGHYTVYLPAYSDQRIIRVLSECKNVKWQVFSKHFTQHANTEHISLSPVNSSDFIKSVATSSGVLCGAGFETPAEALYLGKKVLVIPMKNQYEQHCNAAALKELGVPVMKSLKRKHLSVLQEWLENPQTVQVNYPDQTEAIIDAILEGCIDPSRIGLPKEKEYTIKEFKRLSLKRILYKLSN